MPRSTIGSCSANSHITKVGGRRMSIRHLPMRSALSRCTMDPTSLIMPCSMLGSSLECLSRRPVARHYLLPCFCCPPNCRLSDYEKNLPRTLESSACVHPYWQLQRLIDMSNTHKKIRFICMLFGCKSKLRALQAPKKRQCFVRACPPSISS